MGLVGIFGSKLGVHFDGVDEVTFSWVNALTRAIVKQGRLSFFIHKDLHLLLHLKVTPVKIAIKGNGKKTNEDTLFVFTWVLYISHFYINVLIF